MTITDKAELWILNLVVEALYPIWALREQEVGYHSADYHGLGNAELIPVLDSMFQRGLIIASRNDEEGEEFIPSLVAIEQGVLSSERDHSMAIQLTSHGAERWEEVFQPDWNNYLRSWTDCAEGYSEVEAANSSLIDRFLAGLSEGAPDPVRLLTRETVAPWEATYWKMLPSGQRYIFQASEDIPSHFWLHSVPVWYHFPEELGAFPPAPPVIW